MLLDQNLPQGVGETVFTPLCHSSALEIRYVNRENKTKDEITVIIK